MNKLVLASTTASVLLAVSLTTPAAQVGTGTDVVRKAASVTPPFQPPPISWGRCASSTLRGFGAKCGTLVVPLDYAHPHGRTISIAVSRVRHSSPDSEYQGVMLVNPGGPGSSGLIYSIFGSFVPHNAGDSYDWIGFDPRGVGASRPSLSCDGHYFRYDRPNFVPKTRHLMKVWLTRSRHYARACQRSKASRLLRHLTTRDTVSDMESLRKALGVSTINYYGYSYGTYLGQVYATLHPSRVGRFILDSNVDPSRVWYGFNLDQDVGFDENIDTYFRWLAKHHRVYHVGRTPSVVRRTFYRERRALDDHPAGGVVGPDELTDVFLSASYYVFSWETIADAYSAWINHHRYKPLRDLYRGDNPVGPGADNWYALYLATECTDAHWPNHWSQWKRDNWRVHRKHPFQTWDNAWFNAPCAFWPAASAHRVRVRGSAVDSAILLIGETNDAATPFSGSLEVRSRFPTASLIEGVNGTTHAGSLSGVKCVDNAVARYLRRGTVPPRKSGRGSDKRCPAVPRPDPQAPPGSAGTTAHLKALVRLHQLLMQAQMGR